MKQGIEHGWWIKQYDSAFWTSGNVGNIVNDLVYTGTAVGNRTRTENRGEKHTYNRPKDEWIIVPGAHGAYL